MIKTYIYKFSLLVTLCLGVVSCAEEEDYPLYIDDFSTLYSFLEDNSEFSTFKAIVDTAMISGSGQSMKSVYSSYNSNEGGSDYTLLLPTNTAISDFLQENNTTLDALLASNEECLSLSMHHLINRGVYTSNFPNGEMPDTSINGSSHVIRFMDSETGVSYLIDEVASIVYPDLVLSNGVIHVIDHVLTPLSLTSCEWLDDNGEYSIFVSALKLTGLYDMFQSIDVKLYPFTMFVESDAIFANAGIMTIDDLIAKLTPNDADYTSESNWLYLFMAYHALDSKALYLTDMTDGTSNYDTFTAYPLSISLISGLSSEEGLSDGIGINMGYVNYDTITTGTVDTTFIDYVSLYEMQSNTPTLSGVLHFVNYVLEIDTNLTPTNKTFYFREDALINQYYFDEQNRNYYLEDSDLERFTFGGDLIQIRYYRSDDESETATQDDYLTFDGNYEITFRTTKIVRGDYDLKLKINVADKVGSSGLFDVHLDGTKVGATINISSLEPTNANTLYSTFTVGRVHIDGYKEHDVTLKAVTPGKMVWDIIQFIP